MKGILNNLTLRVAQMDRRTVQLIFLILTLTMFVIGAGAPDGGGAGGPGNGG